MNVVPTGVRDVSAHKVSPAKLFAVSEFWLRYMSVSSVAFVFSSALGVINGVRTAAEEAGEYAPDPVTSPEEVVGGLVVLGLMAVGAYRVSRFLIERTVIRGLDWLSDLVTQRHRSTRLRR